MPELSERIFAMVLKWSLHNHSWDTARRCARSSCEKRYSLFFFG